MRDVYAPSPGFSAARLAHKSLRVVMAGLVPAIHVLRRGTKNVDARDKPGHDGSSRRNKSNYAPAAFFAITLR